MQARLDDAHQESTRSFQVRKSHYKRRAKFDDAQVLYLETEFKNNPSLDMERRKEIVRRSGLTTEEVQNW